MIACTVHLFVLFYLHIDKNLTYSGTMFEGAQIEVVLAKPPDKARTRFTRARNADTPAKTAVSSACCMCAAVVLVHVYANFELM